MTCRPRHRPQHLNLMPRRSRADLAPIAWVSHLRCPRCRAVGSLELSAKDSDGAALCNACGETLAIRDGIPDFAAAVGELSTPPNRSPAQWLMETRGFAAIYETPIWRPLLVRLGAGITMQREIDEVLAFASGRRVESALDLGCGTGQYARAMASRFPDATIWAADLSQAMLRKGVRMAEAQRLERIRFYRGDLHALPHEDASLDWINCSGTLHLLPDLAAAWREISRVLRPGGILTGMIVVMTTGPLRHLQRRAQQRRHATFLDRESLRDSLEAFGLSRFESTAYGGALLFGCERVEAHGEATNHD